MNFTSFSKEDFAVLHADVSGEPIDMLNLIRLRDEAAYGDGRRSSGVEAYATYGRISQEVFARFGGQIVWRGRLLRCCLCRDGARPRLSRGDAAPPGGGGELPPDPAWTEGGRLKL